MAINDTNICAECRKKARLTQEQWAEVVGVSVETVKRWEGAHSIPNVYHVLLMVDACGDKYMAYVYLKQIGGCLDVLPDAERTTLPLAVIRLINRIIGFADRNRDKELLNIAEDGVIDAKERPAYDQIVAELNDIIAAAYTLRYAEGG